MLLIAASLLWILGLFGLASWADRKQRWSVRQAHWIYALALGSYFTSWTFYGTVSQALQWHVWMPPTVLGVLLFLTLGYPLLARIAQQVRRHASTSLADLIATHCDRSPALARMLTAVIILGSVPYLALQLTAIGNSLAVVLPLERSATRWSNLAVAALLLWFALRFGTQRTAVDGSHRGLVAAMAALSVFKAVALITVAIVVWRLHDPGGPAEALRSATWVRLEPDYLAVAVLGAMAFVTLPHVFHIVMAELREQQAPLPSVVRVFLVYLMLMILPILPLAVLGENLLGGSASSDIYTLALPQHLGLSALSVLGFLGGLSAATGMVVMAAHALGIMVAQHWLAAGLLRGALREQHEPGSGDRGTVMQARLLRQRQVAITLVFLLAFVFAEWTKDGRTLADVGVLSMGALAQLMPVLVWVAFDWRVSARTAASAVIVGLATLLLLHALGQPTAYAVLAGVLLNAVVLVLGAPDAARTPGLPRPSIATLERIAHRFLSADQVREWRMSGQQGDDLHRSLEARLAPLIGASGAHVLLTRAQDAGAGTFEAVAELVDATSQEIRFNQRLLHTALENMSQGISVVDSELRLVAWNAPYARLFGFPPSLLRVGTPIIELIRFNIEQGLLGPEESESQIDAHLRRRIERMKQGQAYVAERRLSDGTVLQIRGNPMPGGGFVATFTDVTAFRQAEVALKLSNETLEQRVEARSRELTAATEQVARAAQAKSRFLTALSHDLLQPVNAAQLYARALGTELSRTSLRDTLGTHVGETARALEGALQSATDLLQSLLDMARLDAERLKVERRAVEVDALLQQLVRDCVPLAETRGLALRVRRCGWFVYSDPQWLRRIVQNFLINALRYTRQGGVLIAAQRRGEVIWLRVYDTGPGIEPADQERIFEAFERLPDQQGTGDGLGLGLTIARRMSELLGHRLRLDSTPGRGSVFSVLVPEAPKPVSPATPVGAGAAWRAATVWVVDNHAPSLDAMSRLLQSWGMTVCAHESHDDALDAPCWHASVWLFDFHLDHGHTGVALYERLGAIASSELPPCVLISADGSDQVRSLASSAGLYLLPKPIRPLALRSVLDRWLRKTDAESRVAF